MLCEAIGPHSGWPRKSRQAAFAPSLSPLAMRSRATSCWPMSIGQNQKHSSQSRWTGSRRRWLACARMLGSTVPSAKAWGSSAPNSICMLRSLMASLSSLLVRSTRRPNMRKGLWRRPSRVADCDIIGVTCSRLGIVFSWKALCARVRPAWRGWRGGWVVI